MVHTQSVALALQHLMPYLKPLLSISLGRPLLVQLLMTWKLMSKGLERFCPAVGDSAKDDSSSTGKSD